MTLEFGLNSVLVVGEFLNLIGWYGLWDRVWGSGYHDWKSVLVLGGEITAVVHCGSLRSTVLECCYSSDTVDCKVCFLTILNFALSQTVCPWTESNRNDIYFDIPIPVYVPSLWLINYEPLKLLWFDIVIELIIPDKLRYQLWNVESRIDFGIRLKQFHGHPMDSQTGWLQP